MALPTHLPSPHSVPMNHDRTFFTEFGKSITPQLLADFTQTHPHTNALLRVIHSELMKY